MDNNTVVASKYRRIDCDLQATGTREEAERWMVFATLESEVSM